MKAKVDSRTLVRVGTHQQEQQGQQQEEQQEQKEDSKEEEVLLEKVSSDTSITSIPPCRICQTLKSSEDLISPCLCKGSLGKVHLTCLEKWLNMVGRQYCEICSFRFQAVKKKRYGLCQSIRVWTRHPHHRTMLHSDLLVAGILTAFTVTLIVICILGMEYFVREGVRMGVNPIYSQTVVVIFVCVIGLGYLMTLYMIGRDHVLPWYRWWSRCLIIRVTIDPNRGEEEKPATPVVGKMGRNANETV